MTQLTMRAAGTRRLALLATLLLAGLTDSAEQPGIPASPDGTGQPPLQPADDGSAPPPVRVCMPGKAGSKSRACFERGVEGTTPSTTLSPELAVLLALAGAASSLVFLGCLYRSGLPQELLRCCGGGRHRGPTYSLVATQDEDWDEAGRAYEEQLVLEPPWRRTCARRHVQPPAIVVIYGRKSHPHADNQPYESALKLLS